jgi:hypothetical protein
MVYGLKQVMTQCNYKLSVIIYELCCSLEQLILKFAKTLFYLFYTTDISDELGNNVGRKIEFIVDRLRSSKYTVKCIWFTKVNDG